MPDDIAIQEQTGTPAPAPTPVPEDTNAAIQRQLGELAEVNKRLTEQVAEAHRKITEVSTERATLARRIDEIGNVRPTNPNAVPFDESEMAQIGETAQTDSVGAFKRVGNVVRKNNETVLKEATQRAEQSAMTQVSRAMFVQKTLDANPDIREFEQEVATLARIKMDKGSPFEDAVTGAVADFKQKTERLLKAKTQAQTPAPAPKGATGETAANTPPPQVKPEPTEESRSDYVRQREAKREKRMMGK